MTRDEIISMAREADSYAKGQTDDLHYERELRDIRFAALVAGKEREECAKLAAWILKMPENDVSSAILARGQ